MKTVDKLVQDVLTRDLFKKPMLNRELKRLEKRIEDLEATVDLCGDNDDDVLDSCEAELEIIMKALRRSSIYTEFREKGFKLIKCA